MNDNDGPEGEREAQAAHWYARLKTLPVFRETLETFFAWRRSPGYSEAFAAAERFYQRAGDLADRPEIVSAVRHAMGRSVQPPRRHFPSAMAATGIAAMLTIFAVALWFTSGDSYVTKVGEQSSVTLADGSKIRLDTDTALRVRLSNSTRLVTLKKGQAYFEVAHDANRPFVVDTGEARVQATGTQFDVRRDSAKVEVTLVEGGVRVDQRDGAPTRLRAGQMMTLRSGHAAAVQPADMVRINAWTRGWIVLDGATLEAAIREVNRYTTTPVKLDVPRFAGNRVSGSVRAGDVGSFATAVTALMPLKAVTANDGSISLTK